MTSPTSDAPGTPILPDYVPVPRASLGPAVNDLGYYAGRVERNLYWVTDGDYHSAFLATRDGVVLFDAPPTLGHNLQRAVDEAAAAEGVSNTVTHLVYTHHHSRHAGGSSIFGTKVVRIGHEECQRLLLRDNDPAKPPPEETFADRRTLEIGGGQDGTDHGRPDPVLPEVPRQPLGRGQKPPGRGGRCRRSARHREVHRRAGGRGRVHERHRLHDPGIDPPRSRLPHGRSPLSHDYRTGSATGTDRSRNRRLGRDQERDHESIARHRSPYGRPRP
jgi:hypothetical protein